MAFIKSRKHALVSQPGLAGTALALASLAIPAAAQAQAAAATPAAAAPQGQSQQLQEVRVTGTADTGVKADTISSPKFTQPLLDTPQTITVITKELIQQQNATTLTESLRNTPGITLLLGENGNSQTGDAVVMRGFDTSASIFVDNIRDLGAISRDMFNIEQVEVVKGPSGADNGRGASSGYINLLTKAPTLRNSISGSLMVGSADRIRATADLNQAFDIAGVPGAAFRLNVMKDEGGIPGRDEVKNRTWGVAPSLTFGLGTPTRATFYYLHNEARNRPDGGIPTIGLEGFTDPAFGPGGVQEGVQPAKVDTSNYYGSLDDRNRVKVDMFTAKVEHEFSPTFKLTNTSRVGRSNQTYVIGGFSGAATWLDVSSPDPADWTVARTRQLSKRHNEILTNQTNLAGEFLVGGLKNNLSGGVEVIYEKQKTTSFVTEEPPVANLYDPSTSDAFPPVALTPSGASTSGNTLTGAFYAFDTLTLNEQWKLNAGVRWERYRTETDVVTLSDPEDNPELPEGTPILTSLGKRGNLFSWKVGALYKPVPNGSFYVSYANSKLPPGSATFSLSATEGNANNPIAKPQEGTNAEIGTKWDLLDGRLAFAAAIYRSENKNEIVPDPIDPTVFTSVGKRRVDGVELSAVGQITPEWTVNAGIGYMDAKILKGTTSGNSPNNGGLLQWTPKFSFTSWTTYKLPFGLTVGGGARYIDSVVRSSATSFATPQSGLLSAPDYWVFDAMAAYTINRNVTIQLNVFNLGDKEYVASLNNSGKRYTPGTERSAQLSANFHF